MSEMQILWTVFAVVIVGGMALDLGLVHRHARESSVKEALAWTGIWIALGLGYCALVWWRLDLPGMHTSTANPRWIEYLTCYITEYALSVDNIFVFLVVFNYFAVPLASRRRVLFWGIFGAMIARALFLGGGVALIERFHWVMWILAAILIFSGVKLFFSGDKDGVDPEKNFVLRIARRFLPVTEGYEGARFFVRRAGRSFATPLFMTLLVVETTDVVFAMDSVPAALGISQDTFVLYTSNIFAILGLRSLYFAVAGMLKFLHYLQAGLSVVLVFVGIKMFLPEEHELPVTIALAVVAGILSIAILASLIRARYVQPEEKQGR
jgi:tellurite resistance protein TerC